MLPGEYLPHQPYHRTLVWEYPHHIRPALDLTVEPFERQVQVGWLRCNVEEGEMVGRILVSLDGSALAMAAVPGAEALAKASGALLILVRSAVTRPLRFTIARSLINSFLPQVHWTRWRYSPSEPPTV